jgi:predicted transcriptional regulator of viral defense system
MAQGLENPRPRGAQGAILRHLVEDERSFLDLRCDRPWLEKLSADPASVIYRMRSKGILHDLQRGRYVLNLDGKATRRPVLGSLDDLAPAVLDRLGHAYFMSWHSALWHHGLLDQQAQVLYVADRTHKRAARVGKLRVHFVRLAEHKFFGWQKARTSSGALVRVARIEKALLDSFDMPRYAAPVPIVAEGLRAAHREERLDVERLVDYALRFRSAALNRRLGFFMELFEIPGSEPLLGHLGRCWAVPLAPGGRLDAQATPVHPRWRVAQDPDIVLTAQRRR